MLLYTQKLCLVVYICDYFLLPGTELRPPKIFGPFTYILLIHFLSNILYYFLIQLFLDFERIDECIGYTIVCLFL